jgi:DNA-binding winged helix-turn-helix (wHTH) protein/Tol biopolymer transport system component
MNQPFTSCYRFGEFRLDAAERLLLRNEVPVSLAPKIFDTLVLLVRNAGHLVSKEDFLTQLWPGTFVSEEALTRNISVLRKTLGESSDSQEFIATVPTRGYRFVAPVQMLQESELRLLEKTQGPQHISLALSTPAGDRSEVPFPLVPPPRTPEIPSAAAPVTPLPLDEHRRKMFFSWRSAIALIALVLMVGCGAGLITYLWLSPRPVPRVLRTVQLTHSGRVDPWTGLVSDGSRIYFTEREGNHWNQVETSVTGGESQVVAVPFPNTVVKSISPDRLNFLIATFSRRNEPMPLWIWPVQGGAPKRVGEITGYDAAWCPNSHDIVYSQDDGIYLVESDGTNPHKLADLRGAGTSGFSWSKDGRVLRFAMPSANADSSAIWEVHADGTQLHPLLPGWNQPAGECCGTWSPDGEYFFFQSNKGGSDNIWALREQDGLFSHHRVEPVRLTAGPNGFGLPLAAWNSRSIFAYGLNGKTELMRYDLKSHQFSPLFSALAIDSLGYSRDGNWLAYRTEPDFTLGRMRPDGTQRLALAPSSLGGYSPSWSPDDKQIAFIGLPKDRIWRVFVVSSDGGTPRELYPEERAQRDPAWSPDGRFIAFAREGQSSPPESLSFSIWTLDLSTSQIVLLPGSEGMRAPAWSPDGRFIAAVAENYHKVMLFDSRERRWTQLAEASFVYGVPRWSRDGTCVYYQDSLASGQPVYCAQPSDRKQKVVVTFEQFLQGSAQRAGFLCLAPDGSVIVLLARNYSDVYALDLDLP